MNAILSASAGGIVGLMLKPKIMSKEKKMNLYDPVAVANGILAGLVAITGACHNVTPWVSLIIGGLGAAVYIFSCKLEERLKIDDPLEAS